MITGEYVLRDADGVGHRWTFSYNDTAYTRCGLVRHLYRWQCDVQPPGVATVTCLLCVGGPPRGSEAP